jgi:hypothetical protein
MLDECSSIVGGDRELEAGGELERRHALAIEDSVPQCRFDNHRSWHWREGAEMNPRVRVTPEEMEQDNSSTSTLSESHRSAYTVRSITSFKERTSQLVWPRNEIETG